VTIKALQGIDALIQLLETDEREQPGLVLVGSRSCPPCIKLHPLIVELAEQKPTFAFYDFNVDDYAAPELDQALTALFQRWQLQFLPSQILLPSSGRPEVICSSKLAVIEEKLSKLY